MRSEPLDVIPLWMFFLLANGVCLLALEFGYRLGRWRHHIAAEEKETPVGAMVASILGLLAIVMAFTFNLAASRFDDRRLAVLEESNAIGTAYLRTRLLPEPQRSEIAGMLREYVDVRLRIVQNSAIPEGLARTDELIEQLWTSAMIVADKNPTVITSLFVQSLNEVIDMHGKRVFFGFYSRMSISIWLLLFSLSVVGMISTGYQSGLSGTRRSPAMFFLALAFAGMLFLIVDLDRGFEGMITVSQQSLLDLQQTMKAP